jgi:uncharacterized protein
VLPPRWLADEMLGRLARYMRFVGLDVVYARGLPDEEVAARARTEDRTLLTRDEALSRATAGSVLIESTDLEGQWRELRHRFPAWPTEVAFTRCTLCNGPLEPEPPAPAGSAGPRPSYRCASCGHRYWDGSHTADVRRRLARWSEEKAS